MKTKFKDFLLYSLACIGALSLLISANNSTNDQLEHLSSSGKYQVIMADNHRSMAALNNRTGKVKLFNLDKKKFFYKEYAAPLSLPSGKYQLLDFDNGLRILNVDTGAIIWKIYNPEDNKWMDAYKWSEIIPFRLTH